MSWWTGAALGFDIESDGPVPTEARIITAATVLLTPGNAPQDIEVLVQPERDIPQGAIDVHGITTEHARENGLPRELAIMQTAVTIAELAGPDVPLVGHNVSYDLTLLDREMRRLGLGRVSTEAFGQPHGAVALVIEGEKAGWFPVIDTYVLDKALDRYRPGKRQLSFAAEHYGAPMAEGAAHGATADVYASLRIAWRISTLCSMAGDYVREIGLQFFQAHPFMRHFAGRRDPLAIVEAFAAAGAMSMAELHMAQIDWAAEQAKGLREHFLRKGNKEAAATVDGSWPVRPLREDESVETVSTELI